MVKKCWRFLREWAVICIYHPIKWVLYCLVLVFYVISLVFGAVAEFFSALEPNVLGILMLVFVPHYAKHAYTKGYEAGLAGRRKPYTFQYECDRWAYSIGHKRGKGAV